MKRELLRKGAIISIATMLIVTIPIITGEGNTKMGCYPSSDKITVGEAFNITFWLSADESVDSWLIDLLNFNETILGMANADSVSIDPYWRSGFYDNGTIHNSAGNITGIQAFIMTGSTANTTIFTVNFTAAKPGICHIKLTEAEAYSGGPNVLNNWYNTSLTIYPKEPTGLTTTTVGQNRIDLNWTKQTGMDKTHIRYKTGSNPISITDGAELYNGTGISTSHTGLNPGDTIYYSAWGWNETAGLYSLNYDTAQGQTITDSPLLSNENPTDSSTNIDIMQSLVNVTIIDANGDPMDWTIEGQYVVNTGANGASNGSISTDLNTPLPYGITIIWYVNVTDGTSWTNETYVFATESEPGPIISDSVPMHGSYDISVELSSLSVTIVDPDGDVFNWSIETSPNIGSSYGVGDVNGSKSCNVSGLNYSTTYVWFVNCSDDSVWTREVFSFTTESGESHIIYINSNNTEGPWDGTSEHPYRSIQAGIDAVSIGGTIYVNNGTYNENIVISKSLNLIGAGAEATIVENSSLDHVFYVTADSVNISGFTVKGADFQKIAGIYLIGADHCTISNNNISNNGYGIQLRSSTNNILANNNASLSINHGIYIADSSNNSLVHNYAFSSTEYGIYLSNSFDNTLTGNTISSNNKAGIHLVDSFNNKLADNNISENIKGIYLETSSGNTLTNNKAFLNMEHGIYLEVSSSNTLTNNNASENMNGIYILNSPSNTLTGNTFSSNIEVGVNIRFSSSNTLTSNTVLNNRYGMYLFSCNNNLMYNNYFNNTNNAWDDGNNKWNIAIITLGPNIIDGPYLGGNYWHDYDGIDIDEDGLGDSVVPYTSSGNIINGGDNFPLTETHINNPPNKPSRPFGPTSGKKDVFYEYESVTTDPDGDRVYYKWDWGNGATSGWLGPYDPDETCRVSYSWSSKGGYEIRVKAKDGYGAESEWSDPLPISMPRNNQLIRPLILQFLEKLIERFPILEKIFLSYPLFNQILNPQ